MLLSIITATYQSDPNVVETAGSIIPHLGGEIEWIIKDSSQEVDSELLSGGVLEGARIFFKKDKSLYQGLNQALEMASGKYFLVLGAGDGLINSAVQQLIHQLMQNDLEDLVDIFFYSMLHQGKNSVFRPEPLSLHVGMSCPHPAIIMKTEYAREIGFFDERYLIASDYDLTLRYFNRYRRYLRSEMVISEFKGGGMSEIKTEETALETMLIKIRNQRFLSELKMIDENSTNTIQSQN